MSLEKEAKKIHQAVGFLKAKKIYQAHCVQKEGPRNIIYSGKYENKEAVFKIYDDYREVNEPLSLTNFNQANQSKILIAPELFAYKILSPRKGWLIMEKMPATAKSFRPPLDKKQRKEFLNLFLEYKRYFTSKPAGEFLPAENLLANKFHIARMNKWLALTENKLKSAKNPELCLDDFSPRFKKAVDLVNKEFKNRKKIWIHGHFKPQEIFKVNKSKYYLTDFAHTNFYPEGYELAFIIWADWLLGADWRLNYQDWRKGVFSWIEDLRPVAEKMKIKKYERLIAASIIERIIGSITADIFVSERSRQEKITRIKLLYKLFDELI